MLKRGGRAELRGTCGCGRSAGASLLPQWRPRASSPVPPCTGTIPAAWSQRGNPRTTVPRPQPGTSPEHSVQDTLNAGFASQAHGPSHHPGRCCLPAHPTANNVSRLPEEFSSGTSLAWTGLRQQRCPLLQPHPLPGQSRGTRGQGRDAPPSRLGQTGIAKSRVPRASSPWSD